MTKSTYNRKRAELLRRLADLDAQPIDPPAPRSTRHDNKRSERSANMDSIYIIVKNEHGNPKTPVRWGRQGGGAFGYCLNDGHVVCFESFEEADKVLETFTEPHWYDIIEYRKFEDYNLH